jgi:Kef-type K+ transport system membrane component KefB/nucleotide-binding universal stress UspA family protein
MTFPSLSDHQLLVLWAELGALLLVARALGSAARRAGQPAVLGELVAGLLLGPSVFGHLWPVGFRWFLPEGPGSGPLLAVSAVSLLFVLVVIGAEIDLPLVRRLGRSAISVSAASLAVPLAASAGLAALLPPVLVGGRAGQGIFALVLAVAIGASSLPVIAKIVSDMGLIRRDLGQLAIAAGTANEAVGFFLLALATGLMAGGVGRMTLALAGLVGIGALILTVGQRLFDDLLRRARRHGPDLGASLGVCVVGSLGAAAAMQAVGVEGALGGFAAGVALGRSRFQQGQTLRLLGTMTGTVFSPLYFSTAGLRVDVSTLGRPSVAVSFGAVSVLAAGSKFAGAAIGARAARLHWREATALGVALNGRGSLQVIIGTAALGIGVLNTASYTVVILMSLVTSLAIPPLLRAAVRGWEGSPQEQERLGREERLRQNVVVRGQRLLLPSRGSANSIAAAAVLAAAWPEESEVTVLSIGDTDTGHPPDTQAVVDVLKARAVEQRHLGSDRVLEEIVAEARLGYGVVALGAAEAPSPHHLLSPILDDLLIESPVPLLLVRAARGRERRPPTFDKVLLPVSGTPSSRAGQEIACNLSRALGAHLVLAHVVTRGDAPATQSAPSQDAASSLAALRHRLPKPDGAAHVVLRGAWAMAKEMGVEPEVLVRHGRSAGDEIMDAVRQTGADTIVLGTTVRQVEGHPFLGYTVEQILTQSQATVITVVLPEVSGRLGALVAEASGQA